MSGILIVVLVFFLLAGGLGGVAYFTYQKKLRRAKAIERGLKMVPILIHLPPPSSDTQTGSRDVREVMREKTSQAEVLYNLIAGTATEGFKSNFYGQRHIALELIVVDGLVHFYAAVPVALVSTVKKAVQTAYPGARMEEVEDHNIFNQEGRLAATLGGEMVLRADNGYPIATYDQLERDPMEALLTTVSALEKQDGVALQIMLRPAGPQWIKRAVSLADGLRKGHHGGGAISAMDLAKAAVKAPAERREEEQHKAGGAGVSQLKLSQVERIEEKTKHPGFEVLIRVIVSTGSVVRSQQLLRDLSTTFTLFDSPGLNGFKFLPALDVQGLVTAFIFRFFPTELKSNILNSAELATMFHLPDSQFTPSASVERQQTKQVDGPVQLPVAGLLFGFNEFRGVKKEIRLSTEDRRRHTYILGQTGTGKSTMLENLAVQDMQNGNGFAFIDPHGDSAEKLLAMVPKERAEDVIYFNPADSQYPLGLNLFEFTDPAQKDFIVQETINMLYKLYDPGHTGIIGPRYEHWYRNAALTLMADPNGSTFIEIPKVFTDTDYLKHKFRYLKDPTVIDFWTKEMGQTSDYHKSEMLGWFVSKFGAFQNNEIMRNIIGQTKSSFNIRDVMDGKKILIVNLSKGQIGELNSQLLGMIFVIKFQAAAMSRANVPEDQRADFALYVDEFQNFSTDSFASILSEARKYRLNLIVANQFIGQLSAEIRDAVFGNIGTIVAHRMGPDDAEFMVKQFAPVFDASDLVNIPNFSAAMRLMIGGLPSQPFSIVDSAPLGSPNVELGLAIKQLSAAKFGRDKASVEADLVARMAAGAPEVPAAPAPAPAVAPVSTSPGPAPQVAAPAPMPLVTEAAPQATPVAPPPASVPPPSDPMALSPAPWTPPAPAPVPEPAPIVAAQPSPAPAVFVPPAPATAAPDPLTALALTEPAPLPAAVPANVPELQSTAILASTPPPIGAPPVGSEPPTDATTNIQPDVPTVSELAHQLAESPRLDPPVPEIIPEPAAEPQSAVVHEAVPVLAASTPPPIGAPPVDLPGAAPQPARAPGTLSLNDITGGKRFSAVEPIPEPEVAPAPSPLDDIPLLASPIEVPPAPAAPDGQPLPTDPYAGIDILGDAAPTPEANGSAAPVDTPQPAPGPAIGDGRPLADDPYATIDILGPAPTEPASIEPTPPIPAPEPPAGPVGVDPVPEPVVDPAPQPIPQPTAEPEAGPAPDPVPAAALQPQVQDVASPIPEEPAPEPVVVIQEEPAPVLEPEPVPKVVPETPVIPGPVPTAQAELRPNLAPPPEPMPDVIEAVSLEPLPRESAAEIAVEPAPDPIPELLPAQPAIAEPLAPTVETPVVPDWSNAPEPASSQLPEEPAAEPFIHFVDPAAETIINGPLPAPAEPEPVVAPNASDAAGPSLSGLPEGVTLVTPTAVGSPAATPAAPVATGASVPTEIPSLQNELAESLAKGPAPVATPSQVPAVKASEPPLPAPVAVSVELISPPKEAEEPLAAGLDALVSVADGLPDGMVPDTIAKHDEPSQPEPVKVESVKPEAINPRPAQVEAAPTPSPAKTEEPAAKAEPLQQVAPATTAEPAKQPDTAAAVKPVGETQAKAKVAPEAKVEPKTEEMVKPPAKADVDPEPPKPPVEAKPQAKPEPMPKPEPKPEPNPHIEPKSGPDVESAAKPELPVAAKPDVTPPKATAAAKPEESKKPVIAGAAAPHQETGFKLESKSEPMPAPQPKLEVVHIEPKPEPMPEPKSAPKLMPKPVSAAAPELKPSAQALQPVNEPVKLPEIVESQPQPRLSEAEQIKQAEHRIDDLLSVSLIKSENTPTHKRLPEPVVVAVPDEAEEGAGFGSAQPGQPEPEHLSMRHGIKVIQPLEPIVPNKEKLAAELAELNAPSQPVKAATAPSVPVPAAAAPMVQAAPPRSPLPAPAVRPVVAPTPAPAPQPVVPVQPPRPVAPTQPVSEAILPKPTINGAKPPVNLPPRAMQAAPVGGAPKVAAPDSDDGFKLPVPPPPAAIVKHESHMVTASQDASGLPQSETLQAAGAAKPVTAPQPAQPAAAAVEPAEPERRAWTRGQRRRGQSKPAEAVAAAKATDANHAPKPMAGVASMTGQLILPTSQPVRSEPAKVSTPDRPKSLAPGEVYVDDDGNVVIGE